MDNRIPTRSYAQYSPSGVHGFPQRSPSFSTDQERYLAELLNERQKLGPFMQVMPQCSRLLNQEIMRASAFVANQSFMDHERIDHESPLRSLGRQTSAGSMDMERWSAMQTEPSGIIRRVNPIQASSLGWHGAPIIPDTPIVKRVVRLDVPVDKYPNYNFVGRILGPRGNSLKRVEALTQCKVYIRGCGSVKDALKLKLSIV